jgi:hypothetical protein
MRSLILIAIIGISANLVLGQRDMTEYKLFVSKADSFYQVKDYKNSAQEYQNAFDSNDGKAFPNDRYNAACSFALSGNVEKAFYHLFYSAVNPNIKYSNYHHITNDPDLNSLHHNVLWEKLLNEVRLNKEELEKDLDKPLASILEAIYQDDQTYRQQVGEVEKKYGRESDEMKAHWKLISEKDSVNLIKVKKILDERGWLGPKIIGNEGNSTLFLVIQHADLETQEKYLPMMREAVSKGNAKASSLALLEDRVALRKGQKQIYGSQIGRDQETGEYYVLPLIDPDNVDQRRAKVGLGTIQDYISNWGMTWDVEAYKKKLPEIEAKQKK